MAKKKQKLRKTIYKSTFTELDRVVLCLTEEVFIKYCNKYNCNDAYIIKAGISIRLKKEGCRGFCIIGIKDAYSLSYLDLIGLLTHEITHSVDFIMEEDGYTDMEMRGYMTQDMLVKAMMFINEQLKIEIKENKKWLRTI